jgi:proteic killer suppression protein
MISPDPTRQHNTGRFPAPAICTRALKGNRAGQYSIRVNSQWRICFETGWSNIEIVDYH